MFKNLFDATDGGPANTHSYERSFEVLPVKVSETMRPNFLTGFVTQGLWEESYNSIIILRKQLGSLSEFAGTLLHEIAHAKTGYDDVSRAFENALTEMLGQVAVSGLI
jgi:hypothetical protein